MALPRGLFTVVAALSLAACSINPPLQLSDFANGEPVSLTAKVPFYPQTDFQCGPAALAGLLAASGVNSSPDVLSSQVYLPKRHGSLQVELLAATRRAGRVPYVIEDAPRLLFAQIEDGRPVLVLQNLLTPHFPLWHYAVLVGFDPSRNRVFLNSGKRKGLEMKAPTFLRMWDWAGRWAMVALRPGEVPAMSGPTAYAQAVADFEAVAGVAAAAPAWQAAIASWPQDPHPYLALGNQAYAGGDLAGAVRQYRRGLALDERNISLRNNLASVLGELGCARTGETLLSAGAGRFEKDPNWQSVIAQTRSELKAQQGRDAESCAAFITESPQAAIRPQ